MQQVVWVLVVAGDPERRMALFHRLEREGRRATVADDGPAALALLRTEPFDLVLLDATSDAHTTAEMIGRIRADPVLCGLRVLVTCPDGDGSSAAEWIASGADDIVIDE